jgi:hypothetical protein
MLSVLLLVTPEAALTTAMLAFSGEVVGYTDFG